MARPIDRSEGSGKTGSEELARVVRERREDLGMTRQELADATGIPYPTIAQIETAYRGVSPVRLGVIARVLDLDPKELYEVLATEGDAGAPVPAAPAGEPRPASRPASREARRSESGQSMSWHANPRFAGGRQLAAPVATAPAVAGPAGRRDEPRAPAADVVDRAVELLSALPADQRIEAMGRVQSRVIERLVEERASGRD